MRVDLDVYKKVNGKSGILTLLGGSVKIGTKDYILQDIASKRKKSIDVSKHMVYAIDG